MPQACADCPSAVLAYERSVRASSANCLATHIKMPMAKRSSCAIVLRQWPWPGCSQGGLSRAQSCLKSRLPQTAYYETIHCLPAVSARLRSKVARRLGASASGTTLQLGVNCSWRTTGSVWRAVVRAFAPFVHSLAALCARLLPTPAKLHRAVLPLCATQHTRPEPADSQTSHHPTPHKPQDRLAKRSCNPGFSRALLHQRAAQQLA